MIPVTVLLEVKNGKVPLCSGFGAVQGGNYHCQCCNSFLEVDFLCKGKTAEKAPTSKPDKMTKKPKPKDSLIPVLHYINLAWVNIASGLVS